MSTKERTWAILKKSFPKLGVPKLEHRARSANDYNIIKD